MVFWRFAAGASGRRPAYRLRGRIAREKSNHRRAAAPLAKRYGRSMYEFIVALLRPFTLLMIGALAASLWAWRRGGSSRRALAVSTGMLGALWVVSTPLVGYVALGTLEWPYPPMREKPAANDTVVVLSGGMVVDEEDPRHAIVGTDTFYRCVHADELYRRAGRCHVIVSGGKVDWSKPGPTLAETMRDFLIQIGVAPADIIMENKSSTTYENARNTKELLSAAAPSAAGRGRVFLVSDAAHMRRAVRCFARQGVAVVPAPCDHRARRLELEAGSFLPSVDGVRGVERAAHEWLGLAWYWLRSRI
jgi:uncharacterized SAM-binding protein YcdF (DUF218 family)